MHWKDLEVWKKAYAKDLGYIEDEVVVISDPELAKKVIEAIKKQFNVMIF